jgi:eukaryotic-like serine/threonine-protein kinase
MNVPDELRFLALLVHRGHLPHDRAAALADSVQRGHSLDGLLVDQLGWEASHVEKLRRTQGGEIPDLPGFELLGKLGTGGTADVFRALEKKTRRMLALKVLKPEAARSDATRKSFIAEAKLLETLEHPGLVKGYGVARSGNTFFSRMELVDGSTLLEHLDGGRAFPEDAALRILLDVSDVLHYLQSKGTVHRDVKPGNIMLANSGKVKLIDLGFAAEQGAAAAQGQAVGTKEYLPPEAALGGAAADMRSDIYSLGVTLFHLVVGKLPFESSDDREVLRMQIMQSLSSPELKGRGLSPYVQYFVEKMMAKDKAVRYQSWEELTGDIRAQLQGRQSLDFRSQPGPAGSGRRPGPPPARGRRR